MRAREREGDGSLVTAQRMSRGGNRHQPHQADRPLFQSVHLAWQRPAHPDARHAIEHELGNRAQGFHVEAKRHGGKPRPEGLEKFDQPPGGQHHIDDDRHFGLQAADQPLCLGQKPIEPECDGARVGQNGTAGIGQMGFPGRQPVE